MYRNHVAPRTKLYVPKDDFPVPLHYIDVQRQAKTSLDVLQEATIDDYCNMDGDKSQSEPWIGVIRFALLNKIPPAGRMQVQGRLTKKPVRTRPGNIWPEEWANMSEVHSVKPSIVGPKLDAARAPRGTYFIPDDGPDHEEIVATLCK